MIRVGVVTFPGSLDDGDARRAVRIAGAEPVRLWHGDHDLHSVDAVVLPGGFSYGDYLRCGAIARFAPVMDEVVRAAGAGMPVLGICNGFQILCEAHLLPGAKKAALRQRQIAETLSAATAPGRPVVLAGDINDVPSATMLDPLYQPRYGAGSRGSFVEPSSTRSGVPCRCGPATRGTAKIDYVFGSAATFSPGAAATRDSPWSDHNLLWADLIRG